jgi:hypothetical protein
MGCDSFGIAHRFIRRYGAIAVLFVDPAGGTQVGAERRTAPAPSQELPWTLASAVPLIIWGPCVDAGVDGGMGWMAPVITLPCIGVEDRALPRDMLGDEVSAGASVRMVAHPKRCSPVARNSTLIMGGRSFASVPCP